MRRSELAEVLWKEDLPRAWDASLSAVVSRLRHALMGSGAAVGTVSGCYRLTVPDGVAIDVEQALSAIGEAEVARTRGELVTAEHPCR